MGLAASQARLISLQARMNDTEYEGQQINQQRQVLANKMNEVYNKAMEMEVPTPPSKIDFAYNNAFKSSAQINGSDIYFKQNEDGSFYAFTKGEDSEGYISTTIPMNDISFTTEVNQPVQASAEDFGHDVGYEGSSTDFNLTGFTDANGVSISLPTSSLGNEYFEVTDTEGENGDGAPCKFKLKKLPCKSGLVPVQVKGNYKGSITDVKAQATNAGDKDFAAKLDAEVVRYRNKKGLSADDNINVLVVNNQIYLTTNSIEDGATSLSVESYGTIPGGEIAYGTGKATPTQTTSKGLVTEMEIDGKKVKVASTGELYDELAYDEKMCEYEAAKIEYDNEQNKFNKQTSIYQRQDKQLELKLTRLDNERNALNTEIDAVKKVIQDATEQGFKTFSG